MGYCPACEKRWTSTTQAHCRGCCRQFSRYSNFDAHLHIDATGRVVCRDPDSLKQPMALGADGIWRQPRGDGSWALVRRENARTSSSAADGLA